MKELLVISGKGGTGKTSIVGSFAVLAERKVLADCDVDAADLHLLLNPTVRASHEFCAGQQAVLDPGKCVGAGGCGAIGCGVSAVGGAATVGGAPAVCGEVCRFGAITCSRAECAQSSTGHGMSVVSTGVAHGVSLPKIDSVSCEGCGVCARACPHGAIAMEDVVSAHWFVSDTGYGPMVHARLGVAQENSGKLVAQVRREARSIAEGQGLDYIITDGPPGIGCPVISSMSGVDLALIVTEPTVAGTHDMQRVIELAHHFGCKATVCINKYDLDEAGAQQIEEYCRGEGVQVAGKVPFDEEVVGALVKGVPVVTRDGTRDTEGRAAQAIRRVWASIESELAGWLRS